MNEAVGSFHNEICVLKKKNHLELARWALLRWRIMRAIGYNSAVINFTMKGVIFKRA